MESEPLQIVGGFIGSVALAWVTFTVVSFSEMKKKVDEQLANGEEVYQLKVEPRKARRAAQQQAAQQGGGPAAPAAKQRPKNRAQKELEDLRNLD